MAKRYTILLTSAQIKRLVNMRSVLDMVEKAFRAHGLGKAQMPAKIYLHLDKYCGDFRAMPSYIEGMEDCGIKWVNVHTNNRKHGLPVVMALITINDPATGYPLAIMDGTYVTALRTGAAGGVAAKYLAKKNSQSVGLVGCGVQSQFQLMALMGIFKLKRLYLYDRDLSRARTVARKARKMGLDTYLCSNVSDCVNEMDIVVTTTPSRRPLIKSEWISEGTHINAIGADAKGKEELDPAIFKRAKIVVDDISQAAHSGEINVPLSQKKIKISDISATIGEIVCKKKSVRSSDRDITVFDSTGLAIQDMAVASHIFRRAKNDKTLKSLKRIDFLS